MLWLTGPHMSRGSSCIPCGMFSSYMKDHGKEEHGQSSASVADAYTIEEINEEQDLQELMPKEQKWTSVQKEARDGAQKHPYLWAMDVYAAHKEVPQGKTCQENSDLKGEKCQKPGACVTCRALQCNEGYKVGKEFMAACTILKSRFSADKIKGVAQVGNQREVTIARRSRQATRSGRGADRDHEVGGGRSP